MMYCKRYERLNPSQLTEAVKKRPIAYQDLKRIRTYNHVSFANILTGIRTAGAVDAENIAITDPGEINGSGLDIELIGEE